VLFRSGSLYVYTGANFVAGSTYYYRVRVARDVVSGQQLRSKWSTPVAFNIALPSDVNQGLNARDRMSPVNGETGVSVNPIITWGAVNGATSYEVVISTDPLFADATKVVDSKKDLTTTAYTPSKTLDAGTNYFWQVRAYNGTNPGAWVNSAFTTMTEAEVAPSTTPAISIPPITIPPASVNVTVPTPTVTTAPGETPAWAWVVIVIGAVLVIAVIVLIVRTRRV
jgi:hypothetical protein